MCGRSMKTQDLLNGRVRRPRSLFTPERSTQRLNTQGNRHVHSSHQPERDHGSEGAEPGTELLGPRQRSLAQREAEVSRQEPGADDRQQPLRAALADGSATIDLLNLPNKVGPSPAHHRPAGADPQGHEPQPGSAHGPGGRPRRLSAIFTVPPQEPRPHRVRQHACRPWKPTATCWP